MAAVCDQLTLELDIELVGLSAEMLTKALESLQQMDVC